MVKRIINLILVAVLFLNLAMLFQPYWSYGEEGETASIGGYVMLPKEHKNLTKELREVTGERKLLTNVALPLFVLVLINILGAVVGLLMLRTRAAGIFAAINGVAMIFVFMTDIIVKGQPLWMTFVILGGVTAVLGIAQLMAFDFYPEDKKKY